MLLCSIICTNQATLCIDTVSTYVMHRSTLKCTQFYHVLVGRNLATEENHLEIVKLIISLKLIFWIRSTDNTYKNMASDLKLIKICKNVLEFFI